MFAIARPKSLFVRHAARAAALSIGIACAMACGVVACGNDGGGGHARHHSGDAPCDASECGPPPNGGEGTCVGNARPAYELDDTLSCVAQGGDWLYYDDRCSLEGSPCDAFQDQKDLCEQRIGCAWQYPDGSLEVSVEASGTCSGALTPCTEIAVRDLCVGRCLWETDDLGEHGSCTEWAGNPDWTENASCDELDAALESGGIDPVYAKQQCQKLTGCSWTDGDGTTDTGYVGNGPF